jgi:cytochrome c-type biogenesis protein CcmH/NrfF
MRAGLLVLLIMLGAAVVGADTAPTTPAQQQRIRNLEESLLAPCCWAEPVSVHRSEVAQKIRLEIPKMVSSGMTDREILDYYTREYGARILIEPEGALRLWVYIIPIVASVLGLGLVALVIRRLLHRPAAEQPAV